MLPVKLEKTGRCDDVTVSREYSYLTVNPTSSKRNILEEIDLFFQLLSGMLDASSLGRVHFIAPQIAL